MLEVVNAMRVARLVWYRGIENRSGKSVDACLDELLRTRILRRPAVAIKSVSNGR